MTESTSNSCYVTLAQCRSIAGRADVNIMKIDPCHARSIAKDQ